ncbi:heavy metal translocating P-type ATPase [Gallaecimonas kandeliae]|uniref:heavy metal translocating P-type ATPase n=1 Tax=Gallaecimonas kandeliae TaxID=3029055 RepID=UPI002649AEE1|nr:heavy metal translocating P-type ATPase [Gallaecimonas kandeliae]WKE67327.1 heavy metal translocating P-type ATPase [Gallaecimonas kandeliae]
MSPEMRCFHCHQPLPAGSPFSTLIDGQDRPMCCAGCQAASRAIVDGGQGSYYRFRSEPGSPAQGHCHSLDAYDSPALQQRFVHQQGELSEISLSVENLACAACAWLIERRLAALPGVARVSVNATSQRVLIRWDQAQSPLSTLLAELQAIGYPALPFEPDQLEASQAKAIRGLLLRLGLAGLAAMQVMMFAFAFYFGLDAASPDIARYFRYVSWGLATPVVLYSAQPFYLGAWRSLKAGQAGMDVPVAIAILGAYLASSYATFSGRGEVYFESIAMFSFLLLTGRLLELKARQRATQSSANLLKLVPALAWRLEGGQAVQVAVSELALGDRIQIRPGEKVPTDAELLAGSAEFDESFLTGESLPVAKAPGDRLFAGSLNLRSPVEARVSALGAANLVAAIVRLQDEAAANRPAAAQLADKVARRFVLWLLAIATLSCLGWLLVDPGKALWVTLSVLVASCPCALSLATPAALTCTMGSLAKLGFLARRGDSLETLGQVDTVLFDKTGTLTQGRLKLGRIESEDGQAQHWLALAAALEQGSEHPLALAFKGHQGRLQAEDIEAVPGFGVQGTVDGVRYRLGSSAFTGAADKGATLYLSADGELKACFWLVDELKAGAPELVASLKAKGLTLALLTGDGSALADQIAAELAIPLRKGLSPQAKLAEARCLQQQGHKVMMLGDGVNDAPVLAGADLSVAMGSGTDLARSSSDVVLLGDDIGRLAPALALGRQCRRIIRQNYGWALVYNLAIVPAAVLGHVSPWMAALGMSLSSLLVLVNSLRLLRAP